MALVFAGALALASCSGGGGGGGSTAPAARDITVTGTVTDGAAPLADVEVSVPGSDAPVRTDANGAFVLAARIAGGASGVKIAAGKAGFFNARAETDGSSPLAFVLARIPAADDPSYRFVDPDSTSGNNPNFTFSCNFCHTDQFSDWRTSPHATSATDGWVRDLYRTDFIAGNFEGGVDTCAGCHAPSLAAKSTAPDHSDARLDGATGADSKGVHCDLCHKIQTASAIGSPGVYGSLTLMRPTIGAGQQDLGLMLGSLADSTYPFMKASPSPLYSTSLVCAPCHQDQNVFGVASNDTYTDWQSSPAAARGDQCQACHMTPKPGRTSLVDKFLAPRISDARDPNSIPSHDLLPISVDVLAGAVSLRSSASTQNGVVDVSAVVANVSGGHAIPTGVLEREMLLIVLAKDSTGSLLMPIAGGTLDGVAGAGMPGDSLATRLANGDFAGLPGEFFGRRTLGFTVDQSGIEPDVPYWRAIQIDSDTRLGAAESRSLVWRFQAPAAGGPVRIEMRLVHRRLPKFLFDSHNLGRFGGAHEPLDVTFTSKTIDGNGQPVDTTPPVVTATPPGGVYSSNQSVVLQANEPATIFFTIDGSTPTVDSLVYSAPIPITGFTQLAYFGVDTAGNVGAVKSETYAVTSGGIVHFGADVQPIFTRSCALVSCHTGISPAGAQNLSPGLAYVNIVDVHSIEVPSLERVNPFQSNRSYLINKILGTAGDVGGVPSRMPLGRTPLSTGEIDTIRRWIDQGAPNN
ncbi:MAG: chitobiase/beta-hexosaminidase C-terminal domain-containing protein [Planctomycetes bacterium]|nr:chitobiase/beta-hexosaminidase C-terminal domain-containing protein [Planctomycetota bacterium]